MEAFLFAILLVVLVIRWIYLRDRIDALEGRIIVLERASVIRAPAAPFIAPPAPRTEPPPAPQPRPAPPPPPAATAPAPAPPLPEFLRPRVQPVAAPPRRTSEDWEALIGGNWVNKIGVFVAVIGIALLLNYAWDQLGAAGRVALSLAASFACWSPASSSSAARNIAPSPTA